jgi:hypothetical protein
MQIKKNTGTIYLLVHTADSYGSLYACDLFVGKSVDRKGLNLRMLQTPLTLSGEYDPAIQNSRL